MLDGISARNVNDVEELRTLRQHIVTQQSIINQQREAQRYWKMAIENNEQQEQEKDFASCAKTDQYSRKQSQLSGCCRMWNSTEHPTISPFQGLI